MTADDPRPVPPPPLHPDLDTLADLDAGVLDGPTAERVSGHVRTCAQCAGALRAMSAVQNDLRALPTPPMPAAVAARLDDVLAGLRRAERPDGTGQSGTGPDGTGSAGTGQNSHRQNSTGPGGTAPLPVIGRPGQPGPGHSGPEQQDPDQQDPNQRGADLRGPGQRPPAPVSDLDSARERRRRRLTRIAGSVAAAVAVLAAAGSVTVLVRTIGTAGTASESAAGGSGAEQLPAPASGGPAVSGYDVPSYSKESLRGALPQIEQQSAVDVITGRGDTGPAGAMADTARRTACVGSIRGSIGELQAVRRIMYEGSMAYVFVFSDGGRRTAYVVADDCGTSPALPASVLDTVS